MMKQDKFLQSKCLYYTLAVMSFLIGLYGLGFRQLSQYWDGEFTWIQREVPSRIHFLTGPIVLISGIFQFNQKLRKEKPNVHRWIGRIYVFFMLISIGSIFAIVNHCAYGLVPIISLYILNVLWLLSLLIAVYYIAIKKNIVSHQHWMIRNYALTCSAITLRIILVVFMAAGEDVAYKIATSNCYVWNIILGEIIIHRLNQFKKLQSEAPPSLTQVANSDQLKKKIGNDKESNSQSSNQQQEIVANV